MSFDLNEMFVQQRARNVQFEGKTVHRYFQLENIAPGSLLRYERLSARRNPLQAVVIDAEGAKLKFSTETSKEFIFWSNTAPKTFDLELVKVGKKPITVGFENAWRNRFWGNTDSQIGHSGFLVEKDGNSILLSCSDGERKVSFKDLVLRFTVIAPTDRGI